MHVAAIRPSGAAAACPPVSARLGQQRTAAPAGGAAACFRPLPAADDGQRRGQGGAACGPAGGRGRACPAGGTPARRLVRRSAAVLGPQAASASAVSEPPALPPSAAGQTLRILISTGDVSGDMHGAALVRALRSRAAAAGMSLELSALGGRALAEAGAVLLGDNSGMSSIGLLEALPYVLPSLKLQRVVRAALQQPDGPRPDIAVLLDYPGVNMPFGKYLRRELGLQVVYYIPPNEWLVSPGRITRGMQACCDRILAVYPDEASYFASAGCPVAYVGHPLVDRAAMAPSREAARAALGLGTDDVVLALVPASRTQELRHVWPVVAGAAARVAAEVATRGGRVRYVLPAATPALKPRLQELLREAGLAESASVCEGPDALAALAAADLALTKSGSVNVELALLGVPQVALYRIDAPTAFLARRVLRFTFKHIALVNVILDRRAVPEFVQEEATEEAVAAAALRLLPTALGGSAEAGAELRAAYGDLATLLGPPGVADRAAGHLLAAAAALAGARSSGGG